MGFDLLCCQVLSVTCDNASNNDTMIEELALLIDHFPGDAKPHALLPHQESGHFFILLLLSLFSLFLPYVVEKGEIRIAKGIQLFPFSPYGKKAE